MIVKINGTPFNVTEVITLDNTDYAKDFSHRFTLALDCGPVHGIKHTYLWKRLPKTGICPDTGDKIEYPATYIQKKPFGDEKVITDQPQVEFVE